MPHYEGHLTFSQENTNKAAVLKASKETDIKVVFINTGTEKESWVTVKKYRTKFLPECIDRMKEDEYKFEKLGLSIIRRRVENGTERNPPLHEALFTVLVPADKVEQYKKICREHCALVSYNVLKVQGEIQIWFATVVDKSKERFASRTALLSENIRKAGFDIIQRDTHGVVFDDNPAYDNEWYAQCGFTLEDE